MVTRAPWPWEPRDDDPDDDEDEEPGLDELEDDEEESLAFSASNPISEKLSRRQDCLFTRTDYEADLGQGRGNFRSEAQRGATTPRTRPRQTTVAAR